MVSAEKKLLDAAHVLKAKWRTARADWADDVAHRFEQTHLLPIEPALRKARTSMETMGEMLARIRRECS